MVQQTLRLYRNAYQGLSPSIWLLAGVMLINRCGTMVLPFLTLYLTQHLHYSLTDTGIVMAIYGLGAFVGTFLGGRLTDRFGFYYTQLFSLLFSGFFLLGLQFVTNFYGLCVSVFTFTLLGDAFRPANQAAIAHYSEADNRTRAFSLNRLAINLGWAVGGGFGGLLASVNYSLLFWADGLTCIVAGLVLWGFLPVPPPTTTQSQPGQEPVRVMSPYRDVPFVLFVGLCALNGLVFMQFFSQQPLYFKQMLGLSEAQIGLLMALNGILIVCVEMALIYRLEQSIRQKSTIIAVGVTLIAGSFLILNLTDWPGIAVVSVVIITIGEMLALPFMLSFAVERAGTVNRGEYLALYSMGWAFAQTAAPAFGSQVVTHASFGALWFAVTALGLLAAGGFWWLGRRVDQPAPVASLTTEAAT
ncbi:MFS transporter [Fibrisoma montanum]|uniref:MFS transporter n=1 Tax=Fibrisoma montanum TaxID=2305895 RepID=A0A418LVM7_9BACT|nr:MFS transporter [Fibrisoma montanum]RIV17298.1 MFS transporter [Fibrisoma montanum]